jgi:hypothetical protein
MTDPPNWRALLPIYTAGASAIAWTVGLFNVGILPRVHDVAGGAVALGFAVVLLSFSLVLARR